MMAPRPRAPDRWNASSMRQCDGNSTSTRSPRSQSKETTRWQLAGNEQATDGIGRANNYNNYSQHATLHLRQEHSHSTLALSATSSRRRLRMYDRSLGCTA